MVVGMPFFLIAIGVGVAIAVDLARLLMAL